MNKAWHSKVLVPMLGDMADFMYRMWMRDSGWRWHGALLRAHREGHGRNATIIIRMSNAYKRADGEAMQRSVRRRRTLWRPPKLWRRGHRLIGIASPSRTRTRHCGYVAAPRRRRGCCRGSRTNAAALRCLLVAALTMNQNVEAITDRNLVDIAAQRALVAASDAEGRGSSDLDNALSCILGVRMTAAALRKWKKADLVELCTRAGQRTLQLVCDVLGGLCA